MTRMKSIGDKGSPCLRPRRCTIFSPGEPFSSTCVEEVAKSPLIISRQIGPKPRFCNTSSKKGQETVSKALVISSFNKKHAYFCWCRNLVVCWTNMKLSSINWSLIKALWFGETNWSNRPASLFVRSFVKEWTKLIGLKSLMLAASSFFGRRVM